MDAEESDRSPLWSTSMDDIQELQEEAIACGWDIRYTQHETGSLDGSLTELALPDLLVAHEVYGRGFFACASLPKDFTPAMIPLRSKNDVRLNGLPYDAGDIFIPGDVSEIAFSGPQGVDLITIHLEPGATDELAAMLGQDELDGLLRRAMVRHQGAPQRRAAFEGLLSSLMQEDTWPPAANANRMVAMRARILEDFAALLEEAGPSALRSRHLRPSNRQHCARRARAYLEANLDRAISLAELCRITGTSMRTVQYAFREHYGVGPQIYHRSRRLSAVQQTLKRSRRGETSVTQAALDHGFWHLGRFSEAYKMRFGELPSETLAGRPVQLRPAKDLR